MHCSPSICSGKHICFVRHKSPTSAMRVSQRRGEASHPLAGSITGLWQILILFYTSSWLRVRRPSNDFMHEEAEGQKHNHCHPTTTLPSTASHYKSIELIICSSTFFYCVLCCQVINREKLLKTMIHVARLCAKKTEHFQKKKEEI